MPLSVLTVPLSACVSADCATVGADCHCRPVSVPTVPLSACVGADCATVACVSADREHVNKHLGL